jgi:hypothetical protein
VLCQGSSLEQQRVLAHQSLTAAAGFAAMGDSQRQQEQDEYKINTVLAARRAFERSEQQHDGQAGNADNRRRQTQRTYYTSVAHKYCPCCKDKVSTVILLCNSGLMTVTAQVAVICTIYIATNGLNIVPDGLMAIFLLTCFAVSIFGLCGIIGPVRKTFSSPPLEGAEKKSSNFCIMFYMLANLLVLFIFFVSLCVCLTYLGAAAALKDVQYFVYNEFDAVTLWLAAYAEEESNRPEWITFQEAGLGVDGLLGCGGWSMEPLMLECSHDVHRPHRCAASAHYSHSRSHPAHTHAYTDACFVPLFSGV